MKVQAQIKTDRIDRATLLCVRKKNQPRVFVVVCEKCRYRVKCSSYQQYINPGLFEVKRTGRVGKTK
jgi:uncharacterized protein YlaI